MHQAPMSAPVFDQLAAHGVVPVIALDDAEAALPLADALMEGGLPVAEITFRTTAAAQAITAMAANAKANSPLHGRLLKI